MSGIVFLRSKDIDGLKTFYVDEVGCTLWLDQGGCYLFRHGNFIFGFCGGDYVENEGILTFFYDRREDVDRMYERFKETADGPPRDNKRYRIYQFFARDPEGRCLEFQYFNHYVPHTRSGDELLVTRRSIRHFSDTSVPQEVLDVLFEMCRFSPTSNNKQPCYFRVIRDRSQLGWLSQLRGDSSAPLGRAPLAVAICSDPEISGAYEGDAVIAAYHFLLAAWTVHLGTCWMAALNREDVKDRLGIPRDHFIATITPLGYPDTFPVPVPERKDREKLVIDED